MQAGYPDPVRTTVSIPDALLERAKRAAERENLTLSELVEEALRDRLLRRRAAEPPPPVRLITYGRGGLRPGLSWDRLDDALDQEDAERHGAGLADRAADGDAPPRR